MAQETRPTLKAYFETGDIPTQGQFANLIDSAFNVIDDTADQIAEGTTKKFVTAAEKALWNDKPTDAELTAALAPKLEASDIAAKKDFSNLEYVEGETDFEIVAKPFQNIVMTGDVAVVISRAAQAVNTSDFCHDYTNSSGGSINATYTMNFLDLTGASISSEKVVAVPNGATVVVKGSLLYNGTSNGVAATITTITP